MRNHFQNYQCPKITKQPDNKLGSRNMLVQKPFTTIEIVDVTRRIKINALRLPSKRIHILTWLHYL